MKNIEISPEVGLAVFDDLDSYNRALRDMMAQADEIIARSKKGLSEAEKVQLKNKLPIITQTLRQLLATQLKVNGKISKMDLADGSYDNAAIDNALRKQLAHLRDLGTDLNHLYGTRTVRKVKAWLSEDIPNWCSVKWDQFKDAAKHLLTTVGIIGGLTAGGVIAGYAVYHGGLMAGLGTLGSHLSTLGGWVGSAGKAVAAGVAGIWGRLFSK